MFAMIHLDSNFLINSLKPGTTEEPRLIAWRAGGEQIGISAIAWGEFLCGPVAPADEALARKLCPVPEVFTGIDAESAAHLFNAAGRRSRSFADCCIAATAIRLSARLATSNLADFQSFVAHGLVIAQ
jgi:predicted nucleic acid-binding protein